MKLTLSNSQGMSGRTLRRLPVLAHARHIGISSGGSAQGAGTGVRMKVWLRAMVKTVKEEGEQMTKIDRDSTIGE